MPDCRRCDDAGVREAWGCDAPRDEPVFEINCECGGSKRDCVRDDCEEGRRPVFRCPYALIRENGPALGLSAFLHSWGIWKEHGVLPGPGSFHDQPHAWVQAVGIADHERSLWERERDERAERLRKRSVSGGRD